MRGLLVTAALLSSFAANAQGIDKASVPTTAQERTVILEMCASAQWASRQRFDGLCEYLRVKFDAAEREAKAAADAEAAKQKPADPAPADQPPK